MSSSSCDDITLYTGGLPRCCTPGGRHIWANGGPRAARRPVTFGKGDSPAGFHIITTPTARIERKGDHHEAPDVRQRGHRRGAYEAGIKICSAYPGTPSTEILENLPQYKDDVYCEWAPNEKVATEVAYGASSPVPRSFCTMKMVAPGTEQ